MGRLTHCIFKATSYLFLGALILTVAAVVLVIVVPTLQGRDIMEGGLYDMIESFLVRMLPYIIFFAIGYVISSWGRYLSESPEPKAECRSSPDDGPAPERGPRPEEGGRTTPSRAYRPEVVPPTHP